MSFIILTLVLIAIIHGPVENQSKGLHLFIYGGGRTNALCLRPGNDAILDPPNLVTFNSSKTDLPDNKWTLQQRIFQQFDAIINFNALALKYIKIH
jgi:hypothetical protein